MSDPKEDKPRIGPRWLDSWWVDTLGLLIAIQFAWGALSSDRPWVVLVWPGVVLAGFVWNIAFRLLRLPKSTWLLGIFPLLLFTVGASIALFVLSASDDSYRGPAYGSLVWTGIFVVVSVLWLPSLGRNANAEKSVK